MKNLYTLIFFLLAGVLGMTGCGGTGDGAESTTTREVTGNLASSSEAALIKGAHLDESSGCAADSVIATATNGEATSSEVEEDCSFSLSLTIGQSYVISFAMDDLFLATLIFDSGISGNTTSALPLSEGGVLDLGTITITGNVAIPANEPLGECDYDEDGIDDLEDTDDDEDGVEDEEEEDCDFDGSLDDYDEEDLDCDEEEEEADHAHVLSVKPYDGDEWVDLEREVKARVDCEVDQSTVTAETFYVVSEDGSDEIACEFEFSKSGSRMECDHDEQDFLSNTYYIATVDGVMCMDGRFVEAISWSWLTEETDDDEGCYEDELDDEDELEDEEEDEEDDEEDEDEDEDNDDDDDDDDDEDDED